MKREAASHDGHLLPRDALLSGLLRPRLSMPSPAHEAASPSRAQSLGIALLICLCALISLRNYDSFQVGVYIDDAEYVILARSIVQEDSYGLHYAGETPLATRYPFGFPLLLSPLAALFPRQPHLMRYVSLFATGANAALLFWGWPYLSQSRSYGWALMVAALYALSPLVIRHSRMVMSEPLFTTLVLMGLVLTEWNLQRGVQRNGPPLFLGVTLTLAAFTRTIGLVVMVAVLVRVTLSTLAPRVKLAFLARVALGGAALLILVLALTPVSVHDLIPAEHAGALVRAAGPKQAVTGPSRVTRLARSFRTYVTEHLRNATSPIGGGISEAALGHRLGIPNLPLISGIAFGALIVIGHGTMLARHGLAPTAALYHSFYLVAILLWPWPLVRFLYPVHPFLVYTFLLGIGAVAMAFGRAARLSKEASALASRRAVVAVAGLLLISALVVGATDIESSLVHTRDLRVGATWIRDHAAPDAIIMARHPQALYLYTERATIDYPAIGTATELSEAMALFDVSYLLVAPRLMWQEDGALVYDILTQESILPAVDALHAAGYLELVYESAEDRVQVYGLMEHHPVRLGP